MDVSQKADLKVGDIYEENGSRYQVIRTGAKFIVSQQLPPLPPSEEQQAAERAERAQWHDEDIGNGPNPAHQTRLITVGDFEIVLYAGPDYWYAEIATAHPPKGIKGNMAEADTFGELLVEMLETY